MKEQEIHIDYKARYCTLGDFNEATRKIWFVLHGYGQLARFFIRKFKTLSDEGVYVIAPEGLSKFYLEDVTTRAQSGNSRVGAAWMTSENRLADIENYIHELRLTPQDSFFEPCSSLEIVRRVFRNLIMSFDKMGEHEKAEEVKELLLLIADGADLGV